MPRYNIFHPWILSFFSMDLYRDVARNWRGTAFFYLFVLLVTCSLLTTYIFNYSFGLVLEHAVQSMVSDMPTISITDGDVSIDQPVPYYVKDPEEGDVIAIIDTSGKITSLDETKAIVLLTKNKLFMRNDHDEVRIITLPKNLNMSLSEEKIVPIMDKLKFFMPFILFPIIVLIAYGYRIVQAFLYGFLGFIFSRILRVPLDYLSLVRLSVIAVTPAIIIATLLRFLGIGFAYEAWFYFLISMMYLILGINANRQNLNTLEES